MDVSVIVIVYNQPISLRLILLSLLSQNFKGTIEIIVTDDGSNSKMLSLIEKLSHKQNIYIKYVWQKHRGIKPTEARNNAIKIAKGKILIFLDGDMVPKPDLVKKHFEAHDKPNLIVAGNRLWRGVIDKNVLKLIKGKQIASIINDLHHHWPVDVDTKRREELEHKRRQEWLNSTNPWRVCFSCNLSAPNNPEVYFDENYEGWGNEDWELAYRLYNNGYKPVYLDDAIAFHLETSRAITNVFRTKRHEEIVMHMRNICYFFDKCPGLNPEEIFFGFIRFVYDNKKNKWKIIPRPASFTREQIDKKVKEIRDWLDKNNVYKSSTVFKTKSTGL